MQQFKLEMENANIETRHIEDLQERNGQLGSNGKPRENQRKIGRNRRRNESSVMQNERVLGNQKNII